MLLDKNINSKSLVLLTTAVT